MVLGNSTIAAAGNETVAGVVAADPGNASIELIAPYTGDDNNSNGLQIEWGLDGVDFTLGTEVLGHTVSPYSYSLAGLNNGTAYQIRVTYLDDENSPNQAQTLTNLTPCNSLVHSSLSTGSTKWSADGGWGVKGGKYGEFTCATCHAKRSGNVKRVKKQLTVTDSVSIDQFPIETAGQDVNFSSTVDGSADFGDDSREPATASNNICEACHSITDYHRYDTISDPDNDGPLAAQADLGHYNKADCIKCHRHKSGFKPSCEGCHDFPPAWNSHPAHLNEGRILEPLGCATCHQGSEHISGLSEVSFDSNDSRVNGASYIDADQTSRYSESGGYLANPAYVSCDSLYCHGNAAPFDGANSYNDPTWGGVAMTCASCHDAAGDATTLSGRHGRHTGTLYGFDCSRCHAATVSDSSTISDNSKHLNETKDVSISGGGSYTVGTKACDNLYCHSDAVGGSPNRAVAWSDSTPTACDSCHDGKPGDAVQMSSNAHDRLANDGWIRQYPCEYCHANTVAADNSIKAGGYHVNQQKDVAFTSQWNISGKPAASYDGATMTCYNIYCHSDGTTVDPEVRDFPWDSSSPALCNSCHGHQGNCESCHTDPVITDWPVGQEWLKATPMYTNTGPGTDRANSHIRHLQTDFSCNNCHANTVVDACETCHGSGAPTGSMTESGHVYADYHVNKVKDVVFKDGGTYDPVTKKCSSTACHTGADPQWGDSANGQVLCLSCHGSTEGDVDDFDAFNGTQAKIDMNEWVDTGHGRPAAAGNYASGNPPANFPGNPCWYCHDNEILHKDDSNPYRLKQHNQFTSRFDKECVYCHMEGTDPECLNCHNATGSLSPQLAAITTPVNHTGYTDGLTSCLTSGCHPDDASRHNTGAGIWTSAQKDDVKNQYVMMGVCLQCHDNDDNNRCNSCHVWGGAPEDDPYKVGYDPGTGFIAGTVDAPSAHFGHKHWQTYLDTGKWRGGKFCWDCHDPHGDSNIYMVQDKVATETEGLFGKPVSRADVVFTRTMSGLDYAKSSAPYNGICNVCHQNTNHYQNTNGDGHRASRRCTGCHEHGFGQGHASGQACDSCHQNKPVPNHLGFGLPRDCTKCHDGVIMKRMDILRQFNGQSHHVQDVPLTNKHCYACHWEATEDGLINNDYHAGYNYKTYTSVANDKTDLVIWEPGTRPTVYVDGVTATTFTASQVGTANERAEVTKVSSHCLGCHSDQNNDTEPFGDCKTPRQYAWDRNSIDARYSQTGTTNWGKYSGANAAQKNIQKAFSAHGNAVNNGGGWSATTGEDGALVNTRNGTQNVQCFDCHSSHGSYTSGVTSSYQTFDGTYGGANLKETQAGKGGYGVTYKAAGVSGGINPMSPAAAQCFDCHETQNAGATPWGYESTFGAIAPIMGYRDSSRFGDSQRGIQLRYPFKDVKPVMGGHFNVSAPLTNPVNGAINGTCTPCHDPHGVSPTLGADQAYAVPLLKGTWLTSPFKEDSPQRNVNKNSSSNVYPGRKTFGTVGGTKGTVNKMSESASQFAGLCLRCHPKSSLTDGTDKNTPFRSLDRVHETVTGWGNNAEHTYSCSKCHQAHVSGMPRLMRTNCLDWNHRGNQESGGAAPGRRNANQGYPYLNNVWPACHETETGTWNDQQWNDVTPW
jgi:predicted CxxxxCH...CXXCH cytochrome family protein